MCIYACVWLCVAHITKGNYKIEGRNHKKGKEIREWKHVCDMKAVNGINALFGRIKGSGKNNIYYIFENAIMKPITLYVDLYSQ